MFRRKKEPQSREGQLRQPGVRITALDLAQRQAIAQRRFEDLAELLKVSGCAIVPDPKSLAVNFHTGERLLIVQVDRDDPRRIKLMMILASDQGDLQAARAACQAVTAAQFASKAEASPKGEGYEVVFSVGVYAEALSAFGDSLKAYVDDVCELYERWLDVMVAEPTKV